MKSETLLVMAEFVGIEPAQAKKLVALVEYVEKLDTENLLGPLYARQAVKSRQEYDSLLELAAKMETELAAAKVRIEELESVPAPLQQRGEPTE